MASVVTIVRGRLPHLRAQVHGLARGRQAPEELIVVVMGGDHPAPHLPAMPFPVRFLDCPVAAGGLPLAAARNLGVEAARHDQVVMLDVDCVPGTDLVTAYAAAMETTDALLMGTVRYLDEGADGMAAESTLRRRSCSHPAREPPDGAAVIATDRYELFWSLSFAIRRETHRRTIGGFDAGFVGYGGEDTDFAWSARQAGVPLAWVPAAIAYHQHHPTHDPPLPHLTAIVANARRFRTKWGTWPMEGWLRAFAEAGLIDWDPAGDELHLRRLPTPTEIAAARRTHTSF